MRNTPFAVPQDRSTIWTTTSPALTAALRSIDDVVVADTALQSVHAATTQLTDRHPHDAMDDLVAQTIEHTMQHGVLPHDLAEQVAILHTARQAAVTLDATLRSIATRLDAARQDALTASVDDVLTHLDGQLQTLLEAVRQADIDNLPVDAEEALNRGQTDLLAHVRAMETTYADIRTAQKRLDLIRHHRNLPAEYEHARRWSNTIEISGGKEKTSAALRDTWIKIQGDPVYPKLAGPPRTGDLAELLWLAHGPATAWVPTTRQLETACADLWDARSMHAVTSTRDQSRRTK